MLGRELAAEKAISPFPRERKDGKAETVTLKDPPCQQDPLVLFQLSHEAGVGLSHCSSFLHIVIGSVQIPAVFLHCIGNHSGGWATHPHFAVHKAFRSMFPSLGDWGKRKTQWWVHLKSRVWNVSKFPVLPFHFLAMQPIPPCELVYIYNQCAGRVGNSSVLKQYSLLTVSLFNSFGKHLPCIRQCTRYHEAK